MLLSAQDTLDMILALEGEAITYLGSGGASKSIMAVVDRSPKEVADVGGNAKHGRTKYILAIANDAAKGMTSIRQGHDKVQCKRLVSDATETTFVVSSILSMDESGWQVEITA